MNEELKSDKSYIGLRKIMCCVKYDKIEVTPLCFYVHTYSLPIFSRIFGKTKHCRTISLTGRRERSDYRQPFGKAAQ